jgi:hypothetical protein
MNLFGGDPSCRWRVNAGLNDDNPFRIEPKPAHVGCCVVNPRLDNGGFFPKLSGMLFRFCGTEIRAIVNGQS